MSVNELAMSTELVERLEQRLVQIRQQLPASVRLIAVTKQVSVEAIRAAYALGIRDFAESRIQEAAVKQAALSDWTDATWHLIGHLQTNKASKALELFQWIHSLDSLKLAQRLNQLMAEKAQHEIEPNVQRLKLCLQVKLLPDPNKFGWTVPELLAALPALEQCQGLDIVGLMTIPPYGLPAAETRALFEQTRALAQQIEQQSSLKLSQLSMGMSGDYELAVASGATMIRLGRTLFGERS
jgi:PLP dependent protein